MKQPSKKGAYNPELYKQNATGENAIAGRLSGRLPIIEIDKHLFFVDIRLDSLRPMDIFSTMGVNLKTGSVETGDGKHRLFCYDRSNFEDIDLELTDTGAAVALVRVPGYLDLDPIAVARLQGLPDRYYLDEHPMVMYRAAEMVPITEDVIRRMGGKEHLWENAERIFGAAVKQHVVSPKKRNGNRL